LKNQGLELFITEDGSHSLQVPSLNETYHSSHGAIQESVHVFIKNGLEHWLQQNLKNKLSIFEVGFGTGLNALLTALKTEDQELKITYTSIELYPLLKEITTELNYANEIGCNPTLFNSLHSSDWEKQVAIIENFDLLKTKGSFKEFNTEEKYDVIFFDAFAPSKQPEMWKYSLIEKCYAMLNPNGVFVTYSAKGQLKRDLKKAGFEVESIPGSRGKFEMVRAVKVMSDV
jgi:tRNA U34 5-methylaminomethyl-2-thiouridine-forming methyltransferase MnmC